MALLGHILPLLLTKQRGLRGDNPLGSWEISKKGKMKKEERERGERRGKGSGFSLLLLGATEKNHKEPRVFFEFQGSFLEVLCLKIIFLCVRMYFMVIS